MKKRRGRHPRAGQGTPSDRPTSFDRRRGNVPIDVQTQLASLFEQAPDGIFIADIDGRYTDVNDAGCRLLGYCREEIIGKTILDLIPAKDVDRLWRSKQRMLDGNTDIDEWTLRHKDGSDVAVEVSAKILPDGRWQGFVRDIRGRKQLERALRASHEDLARAQSVAKIGSWRLDVRRNELVWSDENYRIFGVPLGTPMTYEGFLDCVHPGDRAYVHRAWTAALAGAPYDIEHRLLVGGETKWVREKADLEFDEHNVLVGGIGITQDITDRKKLEEELRISEAKASRIISTSADAIISMGDDGRITLFNEGAEKIYGYSKAEVIGAPLEMLIPERFRAVHRRYVEWFAAAPDVAHRMGGRGMKIFGLRKNGEEFPADAAISKVVVDGTRLFTVILRDITEEQRAEDEIRQTQERFELALKGADMATWDWNIETGEVIFNARWAEMRGFRADEIKPHVDTWIAGMHPDDWPHVQKALDDYFNGVVPEYRMEFRVRTKSGQWIWILDQGKIFARDEKGKPTRMVGTEIDITDQKRIEHEHKLLAEVGSMFASTLDYEETLSNVAQLVVRDIADFCIVDVLEDGEVRRVKVASRDPSKAPLCEVLQHISLDRSRPSLLTEAIVRRRPVLMERLSHEMVESLSQSEQHLQALRAIDPQSVIAVPLMAHGALMGAMAMVSATPSRVYDREDLRLAEELAHRAALSIDNARLYRAAGRAIQARDDMMGIVAHDLRNPLGSVLTCTSRIRRHLPESNDLIGNPVGVIEAAVARMNRLIQDLLDVARMEAGRFSIERAGVSTAHLLFESVDSQKPLASEASLDLVLEAAPGLPRIWADRDRLLQVFENLIGNALKFTEPGGRITVGAEPRKGEVLFWVADTGAGIPADDLPHVFDRFWQTRKPNRSGAGLGLAVVKGIVEAHGGRITADSAPERGSKFTFTIPTVTPTVATTSRDLRLA